VGDHDYFSFTIDGTALAFRLLSTGLQTSLQIQNQAGAVLASNNGPGTLTFSVPSAGTYYVRVAASSSTALGTYTVALEN